MCVYPEQIWIATLLFLFSCALVKIYTRYTASRVMIAKVNGEVPRADQGTPAGARRKRVAHAVRWCTPGVIDRAEARGSDSGLAVFASSEPRRRQFRTFLYSDVPLAMDPRILAVAIATHDDL